jgi:hypothetical protein
MHIHSSHFLFLSPRIAAIVLAIMGITSCTLVKPASSENQGSDTSGPYATNQQAVQGAGQQQGSSNDGYSENSPGSENFVQCPARGHLETWYICLGHRITVKFFAPPGNVTMSTDGCVGVPVQRGSLGLSAVDQEIPVKISGKAEDDKVKCTIEGKTTLTVNASGECEEGGAMGGENLTIDEHWGIAEAQLKCECKGEGDCHPYNGPIQLAGLGDQTITIDFLLNIGGGDCRSYPMPGGLLSGKLSYCFQNNDIPSVELVPLVPPKP